jgi:hypothetical protein
MAAYQKVVYFLVAFILYAATIFTAGNTTSNTPVFLSLGLSFFETLHWGYVLKNRNISMFWALMVVVATVVLIVRLSGI